MRKGRGYSEKWKDFREAVNAMLADDTLIWDVPDVDVARNLAWHHATKNDWVVSCAIVARNPAERSGRISVTRHE